MDEVKTNLETVQRNIRQACHKIDKNPDEITIIAVTKYVTIERAKQAIQSGVSHLGENRLEGFTEKYEALSNQNVTWHFIGSLQSRKVKDAIHHVDVLHSLDRMSLAKEINKRSSRVVSCFVQVNVSGETSKHGVSSANVQGFIKELKEYKNIKVVGLMTMAPHAEDERLLRTIFRNLRVIRDCIVEKGWDHAPCHYLSMGMSNDYHIAVEEGATHVRIGTNLVGSQN